MKGVNSIYRDEYPDLREQTWQFCWLPAAKIVSNFNLVEPWKQVVSTSLSPFPCIIREELA